MLSRIGKRLTYANVAVTLALVFAMSGGAYAAGRYLITSTKQISPKVLKALKGKAGANGAQGPAGSAGPAGLQGPAGAKGEPGAPGKEGAPGKNGENGKNGTTGFTETLPEGKTLRGDWNIGAVLPGTGLLKGSASTAVSFGIPLKSAPEPAYIRAPTAEEVEHGEFPTPPVGCTGNVEEPGAEPGRLCVFARTEHNVTLGQAGICSSSMHASIACIGLTPGEETSDPFGFLVAVDDQAAGLVLLNGTWAVTAE